MLIALIAAVVLAQAAPQAAAEPAAGPAKPAEPAAPAKPEKPKVVCFEEKDLGSIMSHRVCRTLGQANAAERQSRRESDALADHLAACHGQPSC